MSLGIDPNTLPDARGLRLVIVCSRFNEAVTSRLLEGAQQVLQDCGANKNAVEVHWVPGSFELPVAALSAAQRPEVAAVICLGAVIRGDTPHFEFVSQCAAMGILEAGMKTGKPVTFGVLTTDTEDQALARAGGSKGNKGREAAIAAVEMVHVLRQTGGSSRRL